MSRIFFPWSGCFRLSWPVLPDHPCSIRSGGLIVHKDGPFSPVPDPLLPERRILRRKRSGDTFLRTGSVNPGTSEWLSRVFPRDPHSDQDVSICNTYNRKICRVLCSYQAVQRLNRHDGKDINAVRIFVVVPEKVLLILELNPYTYPCFSENAAVLNRLR